MNLAYIIFIVLLIYAFQVCYLLLFPFRIYYYESNGNTSFKDYKTWLITNLGKEYIILACLPAIGAVIIGLLGTFAVIYGMIKILKEKRDEKAKRL